MARPESRFCPERVDTLTARCEMFEESTRILLQCWQQESVATKQPHYEIPYPYETGVRGYPARKSIESAGAPGELGPDGAIRRVSVVPSPYSDPYPRIHLGRDEQEFTDKLLRYDYEMWVQHYSTFYDGIPKFDIQAAALPAYILAR